MKKGILLTFSVLLLAGFVLLFFGRDWVLKNGIEQAVSRMTGFKTKVHSLKYDLPSTILIQKLEILNPPGFQEKVFVKIPEIYASFELFDFLKGKGVHFSEIRLHVQEVHIEKNPQGVLNVELLSALGGPAGVPPSKPKPFLLERFEFSLRDVSYQDNYGLYGSSGLPNRLSVDMEIRKRIYTDIHDPQIVVELILAEIIRRETFGRLLNLNPKDLLGENLYAAFNSGQAYIGEQLSTFAGQAGSLVRSSGTGVQGILTDPTGAVQRAGSGLWGKLKSFLPEEKTLPNRNEKRSADGEVLSE